MVPPPHYRHIDFNLSLGNPDVVTAIVVYDTATVTGNPTLGNFYFINATGKLYDCPRVLQFILIQSSVDL